MLHRAGGPVSVKDLQPVSLHKQLIGGRLQSPGRLLCQQGAGFLVAIDPVTDKVVSGIVTDLLNNPRHIVRQQNKS